MGKRAKDKTYMFSVWRRLFNTYSKFLGLNGSVNLTDFVDLYSFSTVMISFHTQCKERLSGIRKCSKMRSPTAA